MGWQAPAVLLILVAFVYRSYKMYLDRLEKDKRHVEEIAGLHLRTIEALALAIEAKDTTTADHLQRVRVYATEIGKEISISQNELDALQAAALLHDIGKLAVPEHIISKPGRLTPEEFDKMKIHPLVGAEILEEVKFPYPVVPIVRAHHEKWDGIGLSVRLCGRRDSDRRAHSLGSRLPGRARVRSAVSPRACRSIEAMEIVVSESGKSFDPVIVDILQAPLYRTGTTGHQRGRREEERSSSRWTSKSSAVLRPPPVSRSRPRNWPAPKWGTVAIDPLSSIAAATQEAQMLYELTQDLGNSLSLQEALAFVGVRMKRLIPYETIAVYIRRDEKLIPEYVSGENLRLFTSLEIPVGQGLSGWVAENNKAAAERKSFGRGRVPERSDEIQHAALGARGAAQRRQRNPRRDGALPGGARRFQQGEPAYSACHQFEGGAGDRERADASAARNLHYDRLSDEPAECALAVPVAR